MKNISTILKRLKIIEEKYSMQVLDKLCEKMITTAFDRPREYKDWLDSFEKSSYRGEFGLIPDFLRALTEPNQDENSNIESDFSVYEEI